MLVIGFTSGDIPKMATNYLLLKSATAVGFYWGNYGARGHPFFMESIERVSQLLAERRISPEVDDTFTLNQVRLCFDVFVMLPCLFHCLVCGTIMYSVCARGGVCIMRSCSVRARNVKRSAFVFCFSFCQIFVTHHFKAQCLSAQL